MFSLQPNDAAFWYTCPNDTQTVPLRLVFTSSRKPRRTIGFGGYGALDAVVGTVVAEVCFQDRPIWEFATETTGPEERIGGRPVRPRYQVCFCCVIITARRCSSYPIGESQHSPSSQPRPSPGMGGDIMSVRNIAGRDAGGSRPVRFLWCSRSSDAYAASPRRPRAWGTQIDRRMPPH